MSFKRGLKQELWLVPKENDKSSHERTQMWNRGATDSSDRGLSDKRVIS
jgi:hypothetical protein